MSKSILMSIQPQWVARILNGDKTIEVRKKFPAEYVGWVYIYCTKDRRFEFAYLHTSLTLTGKSITEPVCCNGKVVARFWCDKVDEIKVQTNHHSYKDKEFDTYSYYADELLMCDILSLGDMRFYELNDYLKGKGGYAIHISKLEIFDKPKELSEFSIKKLYYDIVKNSEDIYDNTYYCEWLLKPIDKAPQSWQYVEVNENDK